jgi:hypothetical protein
MCFGIQVRCFYEEEALKDGELVVVRCSKSLSSTVCTMSHSPSPYSADAQVVSRSCFVLYSLQLYSLQSAQEKRVGINKIGHALHDKIKEFAEFSYSEKVCKSILPIDP